MFPPRVLSPFDFIFALSLCCPSSQLLVLVICQWTAKGAEWFIPNPDNQQPMGNLPPLQRGRFDSLALKNSAQLEGKRGKKLFQTWCHCFHCFMRKARPLLILKMTYCCLFSCQSSVCEEGGGRRNKDFSGFFYLTLKLSRACIS